MPAGLVLLREPKGCAMRRVSGFVGLLVAVMVVGGQASSALASGSIVTRLSANKEAVEVVSLPEGTGLIKVAVMKNLAGEGLKYSTMPVTQKSYTPAPATPVVDMQAATSQGAPIGNWAGRLQTVPGGAGPKVSSVSPGSGPTAGGTPVVIKGSGLLAGATVKIGNPATSVSVVSETEIKATTSATAAGADEVSVTDSKGTSTGGPSYTYVAPPTNKVPPTITGTAQQGQTLTEHHGSWNNEPTGFAYQWLQCSSLGEGCLPIAGATSQTYVPVAGDVGHKLTVQETASNVGGTSSPASSTATAVVVPPVPTNSSPPRISGTAVQGQTLTESHGEWTNNPTSYSYQWQQCSSTGEGCNAISGATGQSYTLAAGDVGHTIRVQEVATNAGGPSSPVSSAATPVVVPLPPANVSPPTISGTAKQGQTLTESHGVWTNNPTSYSYQWQQCSSTGEGCSAIAGASAQTYVPVAGDVGHTIAVQETAINAGGSSPASRSSVTAVVTAESPSSIQTQLSADKTAVEVVALPEGTGLIKVAVMKNLAGEGISYTTMPMTQKSYTPPPATPVVDMQATTSGGTPIGNWAGRLQTVPAAGELKVLSVSPTSGAATGGTPVTLKGSGFVSGASVTIGHAATSVTVVSETEITATTAATSAGSYEVSVTDSRGTSTGGPSYAYTTGELANTAYPGLEVNFEPGEPQVWEEDKEAGAVVGRAGGNLLADAKAASTVGMKLNFLLASALPSSLPTKEANEAESKYPGTLLSIEWGNESYYNGANGKEYAKSFVQAEKEQQTAKLSVPLIMQARLAPDNAGTWMKEVVAYEGIKGALIGNGNAAAPQNWIDSHPYGASMMLAQIRPTVLTESASAYEDTGKNTWGSERWMKEEYFTEKELGISNLPVALTEYGCAVVSNEGNACGSTGEAGYIEKAERAQHYFAFVQKVKEGAVTEGLPTAGWKPTLAFASWFEEVTGIEGFGVYYWDNGTQFFKNEQDGFFRKFKEAAEGVTKAP
jgi:IPT/TIG domain